MKLTNKAIVEQFAKYPFHSQAGKGGDAEILCMYALPSRAWVFYVLEAKAYNMDEYDATATGLKGGATYFLRGIVIDEQNPHGMYQLHLLAALEQTKVITRIYNDEHTDVVGYMEERAERVKDFVPCCVADVVEDMTEVTAGKWCEDLLAPPTGVDLFKAVLRQSLAEPKTAEA